MALFSCMQLTKYCIIKYMNTFKRLLLIINPHAGIRRKNIDLTDIILCFSDHGYESVVCFTRESGDATRLVEEHGDDTIEMLVCMGGDGTLNEVIAGCRRIGWKKPLGYIPAGSTNDFASSLGLPPNPVEAAEVIMTKLPHSLDVGEFNGRTFIYTASSGIFTKASYQTPQSVKNVLGHFAYVLGGVADLTQVHEQHMRLQTNGVVYEGDYIFVAICNTFHLGGVMTLDSAGVDLADGKFELLLVSMPKDLMQLTAIIGALNEQDFSTPLVQCIKTEEVLIRPKEAADWTLDGEYAKGNTEDHFRVIVGGIRMIY